MGVLVRTGVPEARIARHGRYTSDPTDAEWALFAPMISPAKPHLFNLNRLFSFRKVFKRINSEGEHD
jgi:hypothetical protein